MECSILGPRLTEKIKLACHKTPIQNVLIDWLVIGSLEEKNDANKILDHSETSLKLVNGLNHQINPKFSNEDFRKELNYMLKKLLTKNLDYSNKSTRNRKNIEVRGWLVTFYAQTSSSQTHDEVFKVLKSFLNEDCDPKVTQYWTLIAILYNLDHLKRSEKRAFVDHHFSNVLTDNQISEQRDRIYWLLIIWYINNPKNETDPLAKKHVEALTTLLSTKESDRTNILSDNITELFVALSFKPCTEIIRPIQAFIDDMIDKDLNDFWDEKDIHMFKYLILCLRNYGKKTLKQKIADEQVNLYYKIFKLLIITRA
jgi:hypothetical protein